MEFKHDSGEEGPAASCQATLASSWRAVREGWQVWIPEGQSEIFGKEEMAEV